MEKDEKGKKLRKQYPEIKVDYDNIDVSDIMDQMKKRVASKPKKDREGFRREEHFATHSQLNLEEATGTKGKMKTVVSKVMRPFAPLIKLLIFPVYEILRETIMSLDQTNRRLDSLGNSINDVDQRLKKTMEYTKLLHSLSHNIVVELTKLKIEEENLKLKARIMEKDFEFLGKREKALEEQILK